MPFTPPQLPPSTFTDQTPQATVHADAHNVTSNALDDVSTFLQTLSTRDTGTLTASSPWTVTGHITRQGNLVTLTGRFLRASQTLNGGFQIGATGAAFAPSFGTVYTGGFFQTSTAADNVPEACTITINTSGVITVQSRVASVVAVNLSVTYDAQA